VGHKRGLTTNKSQLGCAYSFCFLVSPLIAIIIIIIIIIIIVIIVIIIVTLLARDPVIYMCSCCM
jgi:hypothetical protein